MNDFKIDTEEKYYFLAHSGCNGFGNFLVVQLLLLLPLLLVVLEYELLLLLLLLGGMQNCSGYVRK